MDLRSIFGNDAWLLEQCAIWRSERAQQQKAWADWSRLNGFGHLPVTDACCDSGPLERMRYCEAILKNAEPRTVLLAQELLKICITILAHAEEDPESTMASGPILPILRNILKTLETVPGPTLIGTLAESEVTE